MAATHGVYGRPPRELAEPATGAVQFSPLIPGAAALETQGDGSLESLVLLAPPGAIERRYVLAQALRALASGGELVALAPKTKGGARLGKELAALGAPADETAKRHHRICHVRRPDGALDLTAALAEGAPRRLEAMDLWTQPGVFSWDRIDAGTALLLEHLPPLAGRGADFGAGLGVLSRAVLATGEVTALTLIDIDRRAADCARRNVADPRAHVLWADLRAPGAAPAELDFVIMNPPFHDGGAEDRALGQAFIAAAAQALKPAGRLVMVANRHLPYEAALSQGFAAVQLRAQTGAYKIYEARR